MKYLILVFALALMTSSQILTVGESNISQASLIIPSHISSRSQK